MNEQQRLARQQLGEARQRRRPVQGFSAFAESAETNPFPLIAPIHLYALCNVAASRFVYIGHTTRPRKRYSKHLHDVDSPHVNPEKATWLRKLRSLNVTPQMTILETLYGNRIEDSRGWLRKSRDHAKTLEWVWAAVAEAQGFLAVNFSDRIARYGLHPAIQDEIELRIPVWDRLLGTAVVRGESTNVAPHLQAGDTNMKDAPKNTANNRPDFIAYTVRETETGNYWTRIGAMWKHRKAEGFTTELQALPLDGKIVYLPPKEKPAGTEEPRPE